MAGTFFESSFNTADTIGLDISKNFDNTDSLHIKVRVDSLITRWGPSALNDDAGKSKSPALVKLPGDSFLAVWTDSALTEVMYKRHFVIDGYDVVPQSSPVPHGVGYINSKFLFASSNSKGDWVVSLVSDVNSQDNFMTNNYGKTLRFYNPGSYKSSPSCTYSSGDSVYVVHTNINGDHLYFQNIISNSTQLSKENETEVSNTNGDVNNNNLRNPSVVTDDEGNVFILYRKGTGYIVNPTLEYHLYDANNVSKNNGTIDNGITDNGSILYLYPDAKAFSYGTRKFAVTYWKNNTAIMALCEFSDTWVLSTPVPKVILSTNGRFPTVCGNSDYVFAVWNDGSGPYQIKSKRFDISGGTVDLNNPISINLSEANLTNMHLYSTAAIQASVDGNGNIMAVWTSPSKAQGAVVVNCPMHYDSAVYVSKTDSVGTNSVWASNLDSIKFSSFNTYPQGQFKEGGTYNVYIRTSNSYSSMGTELWKMVNSNGTFSSSIDGRNPYFQYKLVLNPSTTMVYSPRVDSVRLNWNTKPRKPVVDSILINTQKRFIANGDTVELASRRDSLEVFLSAFDSDANSAMQWTFKHLETKYGTVNNSTNGKYFQKFTVLPYVQTSGIVPCISYVKDSLGWQSDTLSFTIKSYNYTPKCSVVVIADTTGAKLLKRDTISLADSSFLSMMRLGDTTFFTVHYNDENDTTLGLSVYKNGEKIDSVSGGTEYKYAYPNTTLLTMFTQIEFKISDPETTIYFVTRIGVNNPPVLDSLKGNVNMCTTRNPALISGVPGIDNIFTVYATEPDISSGDIISYTWKLNNVNLNTNSKICVIKLNPLIDSTLEVVVEDLAGEKDSVKYYLQYPFLDTDNPELNNQIDSIGNGSVSLIYNGSMYDTLNITLTNSGSGTSNLSFLTVNKIYTKNNSDKWLSFRLGNSSEIGENTNVSQLPKQNISVGESLWVSLYFNSKNLSGDGVVTDTLIIETSDYLHPRLSIPIKVIYNDLPYITNFGFDFLKGEKLPKAFRSKEKDYSFPPNAKLVFVFSEPVNKLSVLNSVRVKSYYDASITNSYTGINGSWSFSGTSDTAYFSPSYTQKSQYFGYTPPAGMFISTDSIQVVITNNITDLANNKLDVFNIKKRLAYAETTYAASVDSCPFVIVSTTPSAGDSSAPSNTPIKIVFSRPLDLTSIDTSLSNNSTIDVKSDLNGNNSIVFSTFKAEGCSITVVPKRRFFNRDSVRVTLSCKIKDTMGYFLESNGDGISSYYYDSTQTSDIFSWHFLVELTGFYIFPNPYTPNADSRHKEIGGIVFKNLNRLTEKDVQLDIRIYSLRGNLIFSSLKSGVNFKQNNGKVIPQWIWNTANQYGTMVASGLYYYAIVDEDKKVLIKGKLMITR